jgi:hypothetical protein
MICTVSLAGAKNAVSAGIRREIGKNGNWAVAVADLAVLITLKGRSELLPPRPAMNLRRSLLLTAVLALASTFAGNASAQCAGGGPFYGGYGYGFGAWDVGRLYGILSRNVPYYAAFPPVYYSVPVPRTYGYSRFAYPPGVMTPEVEFSQPVTINNPYLKGEKVEPAKLQRKSTPADKTTSVTSTKGPRVVLNPFVKEPLALNR